MTDILGRITQTLPPDLLAMLAERLPLSELSSLLLEVAARRAARRTPADTWPTSAAACS